MSVNAIKFYVKLLIPEAKHAELDINIKFQEFGKDQKEYAYIEVGYDELFNKKYIITCDNNISKPLTLMALAHEMVHVKQYATHELIYLHNGKYRWQKKVLKIDDLDYWDSPWEIEAYGREKGLYARFLESMRDDDAI